MSHQGPGTLQQYQYSDNSAAFGDTTTAVRIPPPFFGSLPVRRTASSKAHQVFFLAQLAAHGVRDDSLDTMHPSRQSRPFQVGQRRVRASVRGRWPAIPLQLASCTSIVNSDTGFLVSRGLLCGRAWSCVACRLTPFTRK